MGNKIDTTTDQTYDPGIECGTVAYATMPFYPCLLSFFSRFNYIENEYNVASYRFTPKNSKVATCNIAFHRRFC